MVKEFASKADLGEKEITFSRLADNAYAYTAEGDPNTGVIIGDDGRHGHRHAGHAAHGGTGAG